MRWHQNLAPPTKWVPKTTQWGNALSPRSCKTRSRGKRCKTHVDFMSNNGTTVEHHQPGGCPPQSHRTMLYTQDCARHDHRQKQHHTHVELVPDNGAKFGYHQVGRCPAKPYEALLYPHSRALHGQGEKRQKTHMEMAPKKWQLKWALP